MKYKIGDRVIGTTESADGINIKNLKGTVIEVRRDKEICIEFEKHIAGHDCGGVGKLGHCWWVDGLAGVKKISDKKIVITSDGAETLARLYEDGKVVKSATAKCNKGDEFDFSIGAKLAFDRLLEPTKAEESEDRYFNGKAVCVKSDKSFTIGKIYNFIDGKVKDDNGSSRPFGYRAEQSFENWKKRSCGMFEFIPLVEDVKGE